MLSPARPRGLRPAIVYVERTESVILPDLSEDREMGKTAAVPAG